jgi:hypothetical protein
VASNAVRPTIEAYDLLPAVATLRQGSRNKEAARARKMVELLVDSLRYGAKTATAPDLRR